MPKSEANLILRRVAANAAIWLRSTPRCSDQFLVSLGLGIEGALRELEAPKGLPCPRCVYLLVDDGLCTHCNWAWSIEDEDEGAVEETQQENDQ